MEFTRHYAILLKSFMSFYGLCLLIGCSADKEIQSARLMEANAYYYLRELNVRPLPLNGRGIISLDDTIELVFDKPVRQVSINDVDTRPNQVPTATVWLLETRRLEVWDRQEGWNPEKDVTLRIVYVDETGVHSDTLDVTLGAYDIYSPPPEIDGASVGNNQTDADADQLNREGIWIGFNAPMDTQRTQIEVYSGQMRLNWRIDWIMDNYTAILSPEIEDDRLLPGHEYEIHLVDFYDIGGDRGKGLEDGPIVIKFQTARAEPDSE